MTWNDVEQGLLIEIAPEPPLLAWDIILMTFWIINDEIGAVSAQTCRQNTLSRHTGPTWFWEKRLQVTAR